MAKSIVIMLAIIIAIGLLTGKKAEQVGEYAVTTIEVIGTWVLETASEFIDKVTNSFKIQNSENNYQGEESIVIIASKIVASNIPSGG